MNHSFEQLLIDVYVARRERLVPDEALREALARTTAWDSADRLSGVLEREGAISPQRAAEIDQKGSAYHQALVSLGFDDQATAVSSFPSSGSTNPGKLDYQSPGRQPRGPAGEFDTLMEGSSIDSADSDTPRSGDHSSVLPTRISSVDALRYQKSRPHAEGGLGKVWVAADRELNRQVALKEIQPEHADDIACQLRFLQEAEITGSLEHPGIVPVYGLGRHADGRPYYAMRFIEGTTLKHAIDELFQGAPPTPFRDRKWRVDFRRVLNRFLDVCNTIEYAHSRQIIHRDIKPSNIMLGAYGETLLVDWGLAKSLSEKNETENQPDDGNKDSQPWPAGSPELTMQGTAVGTPAYMSPEQAAGGRLGSIGLQSDVYSLGATLFHLLVGSPPTLDSKVDGSPSQVGSAAHLSPRERRSDVPPALAAICQRAMATASEDRYGSAKELSLDIENWLADQPVTAHDETASEQIRRWIRNHPTAVVTTGVLCVCMIAATATGLFFWNRYQLDIQREQAAQQQLQFAHQQQVSASAGAAHASALAEIRNNRFEAALEFLANAEMLLAQESALRNELRDVRATRERAQRLLEFHQYVERAEELAFRDSSRRASILLQRGLHSVGAFKQLEWWNALPSEDLLPRQVHELRTKTYRALFLLAALRLKETLPSDLNFEGFLKLVSAESRVSNQSSVVVCNLLDAYRKSQGAELGRLFANERGAILSKLLQSVAFKLPTVKWDPHNASDLYIMGTSLAYLDIGFSNEQKKPFETVLGITDARKTSQRMLSQAAELKREHYWTQLVRAFFESEIEDYESSWRSYSHTISLNPDHWLGYAWLSRSQRNRALELDSNDPMRKELLARAVRNSERAVDLQPDARIAHTIRAIALAWHEQDLREATASNLESLNLQEPLDGINDVVVEMVDRDDLIWLSSWCRSGIEDYPNDDSLYGCLAWSELQQKLFAGAVEAARMALELSPKNREARYVVASVDSIQGRYAGAETVLKELCREHPSWHHAWFRRGLNAEKLGELAFARRYFEEARATNKTPWQARLAQVNVARLALMLDEASAIEAVAEAIRLSETEPLDAVLNLAIERKNSDAEKLLEDHHLSLQPITRLESDQPPATAPVLNGGFELGLTTCWGDTLDKISSPAWQRFGGCLATAAVVEEEPHSGDKCLHIKSEQNYGEGAYAELTQHLPVQIGEKYLCEFFIRADRCDADSVVLKVNDITVATAPSSNYDWTKISGEFTADIDEVTLRIRCQGAAHVHIDSINITTLQP